MPRASARLSPASNRSARLAFLSGMEAVRVTSARMSAPAKPRSRPLQVRGAPAPLHGGPLTLLRFMRRNGMLNLKYGRLIARWAWLKLRWRGRLQTDGLCFVAPDVTFEIGRD